MKCCCLVLEDVALSLHTRTHNFHHSSLHVCAMLGGLGSWVCLCSGFDFSLALTGSTGSLGKKMAGAWHSKCPKEGRHLRRGRNDEGRARKEPKNNSPFVAPNSKSSNKIIKSENVSSRGSQLGPFDSFRASCSCGAFGWANLPMKLQLVHTSLSDVVSDREGPKGETDVAGVM